MEQIKNSSRLSETIMEQNRHLFIYGYDGKNREDFLKDMADKYPIQVDKSQPMGIYLDSLGLPVVSSDKEVDKITISSFAQNYCSFLVVSNIVNTAVRQVDLGELNNRSKELLKRINRLFLNKDFPTIETIQDLNSILLEVRQVYFDTYYRYLQTGKVDNFLDSIPISFIDINMFIKYFKSMLNNNSYFGIIADYQSPVALKSIQAINGLIASRINADISMKVACQSDKWDSYVDLNGVLVESTHDYGTIELDSSIKEYTKKLRQQYYK